MQPLKFSIHQGGEAQCKTPQVCCRTCSRAGWSFGRFVLWIGPLWPTSRCGWCGWEQHIFYWDHRQNANVKKLAGGVCWGQSQEITSASELLKPCVVVQASEIVPEGQAAPAAPHCFTRQAGTWQRVPVLSCGQGEGSWGRYWNGAVKVTPWLPESVTGTGLAQGMRTAPDLEPLCKFTRGYGKVNTGEPSKGCGG